MVRYMKTLEPRIRWRNKEHRCCLFGITGDVWEVQRREALGRDNVHISGSTREKD
jgi:hypothetical protein